jgi:hypothetical protein
MKYLFQMNLRLFFTEKSMKLISDLAVAVVVAIVIAFTLKSFAV